MINQKFNKNTIVLILFLSFFVFIYLSKQNNFLNSESVNNQNNFSKNCVDKIEERLVRGNSLSGLIESNQTVKILFGFYACREIKRGDIIAYNYAGNPDPIIKIVKGMEGDGFRIQKNNGDWLISINNEIVKNSGNQPYVLNEKGYKMLSLYEKDYKGVIPKNAYLILGNAAEGTLDSTAFGLIDKSDILGKVEY